MTYLESMESYMILKVENVGLIWRILTKSNTTIGAIEVMDTFIAQKINIMIEFIFID